MEGFKKFLLRGNLVDLAVAVVVGAAFGTLVKSLVADLLTPLIAAIGGQPDFSRMHFTLHGSVFQYGDFLNALIAFLIVATALYFGVVLPVGKLLEHWKPSPAAPVRTSPCPHCRSEIALEATVCAFCTRDVEPVTASADDRSDRDEDLSLRGGDGGGRRSGIVDQRTPDQPTRHRADRQ
ncbi:MAG TPA: large conductance mechanosensitive channel protein MscL [Sporichthyaceae bacterium]|jgi:large conductance mechanosensitive channel